MGGGCPRAVFCVLFGEEIEGVRLTVREDAGMCYVAPQYGVRARALRGAERGRRVAPCARRGEGV